MDRKLSQRLTDQNGRVWANMLYIVARRGILHLFEDAKKIPVKPKKPEI